MPADTTLRDYISWEQTNAMQAEGLFTAANLRQDAFAKAQDFSCSNAYNIDDIETWIDDPAQGDEGFVRHAALPLHPDYGTTFLFVIGCKSKATLRPDGKVNLVDLGPKSRGAGALIVANVSEIFDRTLHCLGLESRDVFKEAYPEATAS